MRNGVEKGADIKVQHPVLRPAPAAAHGQRVMGAAPRTVPVAVPVEDRLQFLLQQHRRRSLRHPVARIGHAEQTHAFPMIFRYLHAPHRTREIAPRAHPVPQLEEIVPQPFLEQADADRVHARRPVVGPDLLPRLHDEALTRSQTTSPSARAWPPAPPLAGWPRADPGLHGSFAPAPLQDLHRYYEPSRPCAPPRYSAARGVRRSRSSLSRPKPGTLALITWPPLSGRQVLLFRASARDELTPPLHRAPPGQHAGHPLAEGTQPARLCPGSSAPLRF